MNHLDLFSGIGGFAYAVDQVWENATHTFCEIDPFCQKVLAKHWPESKTYADIQDYTSNNKFYLLTGGFPCQPFSSAGKRRGTEDNRYLWPEMLRVIRLAHPTWIIGENVGGLVTWNEGMVLEQVCVDLEDEGYEVQPLIIPACAVNAPHRRDRVWIVANRQSVDGKGCKPKRSSGGKPKTQDRNGISLDTYTTSQGLQEPEHHNNAPYTAQDRPGVDDRFKRPSWDKNWLEVATRFCRMDDGVSDRVHRLKVLGNAIVPQVAVEIMKAIKLTHQEEK